MKKLCVLLSFMALPCLLSAQQNDNQLWGVVTIDSLQHVPYEGWFKFGDKEKALAALETGLQLNKNPEFSKAFLTLQKEILEK